MKRSHLAAAVLAASLLAPSSTASASPTGEAPGRAPSTAPRVTYHWHQHQPIYWNARLRAGGVDRYEYAWDSIQQKNAGAIYPMNDLDEIFGKPDRVDAYQFGMRNSIATMNPNHPNGGVSISYSGALMENIDSLGQANQLGYGPFWRGGITEPHGWKTDSGAPRLDLLNFTFHHSLTGLQDERTLRMEIELFREKVRREMGEHYLSRGFFPTELTFSTRLIPMLADLGIEWSLVSGEKIARAMPDFPVILGSGGVMCAPPNPADMRNPPGTHFIRTQINRGCSPVNANPASFQPAWARYIDPDTGVESRIMVIPVDQAQSWRDGEQCIDAAFLEEVKLRNDPAQPSIVVLCHDGDNAFGGGFTYYNQCVQDLANNVAARGGLMSTVEEYLADFPPDPSRVVHVEDGGWVNADSDFGSPTFINWNYPLLAQNGQVDVVNGWHEKPRDMAIFTASLNRVLTAEQIHGHEVDLGAILYPDASTHPIDRAWHYHLGSLDSGNVYFGPVLDLEIKATIGANEVARLVDPLLQDLSNDQTPPTIWLPQRFPYNPGGRNFGVEFGYQEVWDDGDFHIWTFIHDASGPVEATLKYRIDADGVLPIDAIDNHTYAGGPDVGPWISLPMDYREFPKDMPAGYDNGAIDLFVLPEHIAGHYSVEVAGLREVLIDYYVEAVDAHGNIARSPIQHVYVGDGSQAPIGGGGAVALDPDPPVAGMPVAIEYDPTGRVLSGAAEVFLYWGWNNWGTLAPSTVPMAQTPDGTWTTTVPVPADAAQIDMVFNNGAGTWDNNNGQDWKFPTVPFDGGPILSVSPSSLSLTMTAGEPGAQGVLAVSNSGTGTLAYTASVAGSRKPAAEIAEVITGRRAASPDADANQDGVVDAADAVLSERDPGGPAWLSVAGNAQGEVEAGAPASQVAVLVDGAGLAPGTYAGEVLVRAPGALQAPQSIGVVVTVLDGSVPESTTVVPNPPAAGQNATVWYDAAAGPFPGASTVNLHWGINGGAAGGGAWQGVTTTPMAPGPGSMWFATIALPANAASLNFVTNNGSGVWDNNSGQNWNFAVE